MIETLNTAFLFSIYIPLCFIFSYGVHKGAVTGNGNIEDIAYIFGKKIPYYWCFVPFVTWIFVLNIPSALKNISRNSIEAREKRSRTEIDLLLEQLNEPLLRSKRIQRQQRSQELLKKELMKDNKGKLIL